MVNMNITLAFAAIVAISVIGQVSADSQGVFELKLQSFLNLHGKDAQGHCCEGYRTASGKCSGRCSTKFRVCLKHYQANIDPSNECTFGEFVTPVLGNNVANYDPIRFPIDFKWPGTFSLIIEAWHENNETSVSKALISRLAKQERVSAGSDWTHGVHQESHTKLEYEYRMVCSSHYFGGDCDTLCRPRDDQFGHYTCDVDGVKRCLHGWQKDPSKPEGEGDYCTKAVCLPGCHSEHGECDRPGTCKCKQGWTGQLCDQCIRYPGCVHGSCDKPHQCNCDEGWGGLFCNQDLNYCTNHRPCKNGATCRNTGQGSYTCSCPPGYSGTNCESRISNECSHNPCANGGTCQASSGQLRGRQVDDFTCVCPLGFHGRRCEKRAQTCSDRPCQNGAACTNTGNSIGYHCNCPREFHGVNCDVKVNSCRVAPCQNGGTCSLSDDGENYQCRCPAGFGGKNCEMNVDDCAMNPCQNGGTCFDFVNDYKCYCHAGFIGRNCEHNVDDCSSNPCDNGGTCHDSVNDFVCTCRPGYTGKDCSQEINECFSSPCMNGGFCIDRLNDFECKCLPGYSLKHCNRLPDGTVQTVLGRTGEQSGEDMTGSQMALVATFSTVIPMLVVIAVVYLWCSKQRRALQRRKEEDEATRQNELNAVNCINKTKMLDDYKIVNTLDYPGSTVGSTCTGVKSINTNPNLADDDMFSAKDSSYAVQKTLNTSMVSSRASMLCDKLDNGAASAGNSPSRGGRMMPGNAYRHNSNVNLRLGGYNDCASSTVSSSAASSVCSSDNQTRSYCTTSTGASSGKGKGKSYDLPTASSVNSEAAASRREAYYASIEEARSGAASAAVTDDLFATEV